MLQDCRPLRAKGCTFPPARASVPPYNAPMLAIVLSTIAFFVASFFIKRYLDEIGIPRTMVRGMMVFVLALAVAYGVALLVGLFSGK
jgi:VIT1/CCC1 family predicted Fe2+/Mn2+ transporter